MSVVVAELKKLDVMTQVYDVIVIGCGAAGVAALTKLTENKFQVLGLEASGHLGGRIETRLFGDNVIDMGAQWCHGEKNNIVYSIVKDLNVISPPSGHREMLLMRSVGNIYTESDSDRYFELCSTILKEGRTANLKKSQSLYAYMKYEFNKKLQNMPDVNINIAKCVLEWYLKSIQAKMSANELLEKSLNGLKESWDNQGEQWLNWKDRGYKTIIDILLKKYPDPSEALPVNILLNKEVMNIKWNNLHKENSNPRPLVQVTCRDGSLFAAKHAIVTVSVGVLKERYEKLFTPSVPDDKIISIRSLAMCTMNKIYMQFSNKWWPKSLMRFGIVWNEDDKFEFCNEYDDWLTGIYEITTVEFQPNLLCAWITGPEALNMESCSSDVVSTGMYRLIKHFFIKHYDVTKPINILRSTWYTNSLTRGSFSYRSIETECVDKGAVTLGLPLSTDDGVPIVCFAGEATSLHHHSTVHGAVESGFREADRLMEILRQ